MTQYHECAGLMWVGNPERRQLGVVYRVLVTTCYYISGNMYALLCQLAHIHLPASASSVLVECMFSTTGLVMNANAPVSAEKLNRVCFIHDNYSFAISNICVEQKF